MRLAALVLLLSGCGSNGSEQPVVPAGGSRTVATGGDAAVLPAPGRDAVSICTIELDAALDRTVWRRELVDDEGRPRSKAVGSPPSVFDYAYDDAGRMKSAPLEDIAAMMYFDYAGAQLTVSSDVGGVGYYRLDAHGRVLASLDAAAASDVFKFSYDAADRLLTEVDPTGGNRSYKWEYDAAGFVTAMTMTRVGEGCRRTWSWIHDAFEVVVVRDELGHERESCSYQFDALDRLVAARCDGATSTWLHPSPDVVVTTIALGGSIVRVERATGRCQIPTRGNLAALIEPVPTLRGDPRPSRHQLRRLGTSDVPRPMRRCDS